MNLSKKKELAARTFGVGKERIVFIESRINEIKEAITRQDIKGLVDDGAILIKNIKGSLKYKKKKRNRTPGNIKKKLKNRKRNYIIMTRKLRKHVKDLKKNGKISRDIYVDIRKKIRNKFFRDKGSLKEYLSGGEKKKLKRKK